MRRVFWGVLSCLYPFAALLMFRRYHSCIPVKVALALKLYPVGVNICLLGAFAYSLIRPPSIVERFARLARIAAGEPELTPCGVRYACSVTKCWCLFFVLNGLAALATALWGSDETWALYNGVISYALTGSLMGIEWLVRQRVLLHDPA
jgi:uncharacterized membrane protein